MSVQRIGKYEVLGKIGQGAMGEVFRARDPVLNREVAIKRITAGLDADENVRKRFQREAQSAAKLMHPNIIKVYELGFEGEQLFMAMELLDGIDLKHALARRKLGLDEKLEIVEQIAAGLAFAHAHEIVHRDLKPANIHILPNGTVKIMDFGLARLAGSEMTSTGMVMGTPHYMSPEQVRGQKADARSDVFALGCVFYELLTGRKPFDAESMHAVLFKVMQEDPPPARDLAPGTPESVLQVLEASLAKNPAERFQNAGDMLAALRHARQAVAAGRGHEPIAVGPAAAGTPGPGARRQGAGERSKGASAARRSQPAAAGRRRGLLIGLGVGLVIVAAVAAGLGLRALVSHGSPEPAHPTEVLTLAQAVIDTRVELARRRLEAGDFADAARQADSALKLDPANEPARRVRSEAAAALKRLDDALAALRAARAAGPPERVASAALEVMKLAPDDPDAEKAATAAGAAFRARVEDARRLAQQAREAAVGAGGERSPAFGEAAALQARGDQAAQAGQAAQAARSYLQARRGFERASRPAR
jgi:serine/threonine-protein kinase